MTPSTTKGRPAATGRPLKPESGGNRSQANEAPTRGRNMNTTDPTAPAWATDVGARQVWRSARTNLGLVDLVAQQLPNGEVINARLDLTEIHQVPLADPATDIYELALALMELAQAYMPGLYADIDSLIEAQDRRRLSRRADR